MNKNVEIYIYFKDGAVINEWFGSISEAYDLLEQYPHHDGYMILDSAGEFISYVGPEDTIKADRIT